MKKEDLSSGAKLLLVGIQSLLSSCGFVLEDAINEAKNESDLLLVCGNIIWILNKKVKNIANEGIPDCLMIGEE